MTEPLVVAVMLTRDRPEMARRAVECFRAQTYDPTRRLLVILDTGAEGSFVPSGSDSENEVHDWRASMAGHSIGWLRNDVNTWASQAKPDIICHFDDDDWSHPNRISEQVAMLQSSGADAVGYNSALFWDTNTLHYRGNGEAWLYTAQPGAQALGASLMYWRKTWERQPFEDKTFGEDLHFQLGLKVEAVSSLADRTDGQFFCYRCGYTGTSSVHPQCPHYACVNPPRLICTVHGGNTSTQINPAKKEWKRAADWDEYCRKVITNA